MSIFHRLLIVMIVCASVSGIVAWNGPNYECDEDIMEDGYCYLVASEDCPDEWQPLTAHDVDISIADDFYRCFVDTKAVDATRCVDLQLKPFEQGYELYALSSEDDALEGENWMYTMVFEIMAPIRDKFMYDPWALVGDSEEADEGWATYTKIIEDCNMAESIELYTTNGVVSETWTLDELREGMYPIEQDIAWSIIWFLEDVQHQLICAMTDLGDGSNCAEYRGNMGIKDGQWSDCWVDTYELLYGVTPSVDGELYPNIWTDRLEITDDSDVPTFGITANIDTYLYCIAQEDDEHNDFPIPDQIIAGLDANNETAPAVFEGQVTADELFEFQLVGLLVDGWDYIVTCATSDGVGSSFVEWEGTGVTTGSGSHDSVAPESSSSGPPSSEFNVPLVSAPSSGSGDLLAEIDAKVAADQLNTKAESMMRAQKVGSTSMKSRQALKRKTQSMPRKTAPQVAIANNATLTKPNKKNQAAQKLKSKLKKMGLLR